MEAEEIQLEHITKTEKDIDSASAHDNISTNNDSSNVTNNNVPRSGVNQETEADRMSNDSPMFNVPSPQDHDILASSSSSEDALKSLEKLENLARLAENAALEDRDVETPQSFVNAEDVNDDIGAADDLGEDENADDVKKDYTSQSSDNPVNKEAVVESRISEKEEDEEGMLYCIIKSSI